MNATIPTGVLSAVSCTAPTSCLAVGYGVSRGGDQTLRAERWDGTAWAFAPPPAPSGTTDALFTGVSCAAGNACTAVGYVYTRRGTIQPLAERWDGTRWTVQPTPAPLGSPAAGLFAVSCASATACTAVGDFNDAVGVAVTLVESWDGHAWTIVPSENASGALANGLFGVSCLAADSCRAVGSSVTSSGTQQPLAESSTSGVWGLEPVPVSPDAQSSGLFGVACTTSADCIAVGNDATGSGVTRPYALRRDATGWSLLSPVAPTGSTSAWLSAVSCTAAAQCTAIGQYDDRAGAHPLAERWDGSAWNLQQVPAPAGVLAAQLSGVSCATGTDCLAVGTFNRWPAPVGQAFGAVWAGSTWVLHKPLDRAGANTTFLRGVACPTLRWCLAVGARNDRAGTQVPFAESRRDGRWRRLRTPAPTGAITSQLNAVGCSSTTACTAVGTVSFRRETARPLAERWNGHHWRIQRIPRPTTATFATVEAVACPAVDSCVAVGHFSGPSGVSRPLAARWNGHDWLLLRVSPPTGAGNTRLLGIACPAPNRCTAVGSYEVSTGSRPLAVRWNGRTWRRQAMTAPRSSLSAELAAVSCPSVRECVAVGDFVNVGDRSVPLAERWHAGTWRVQRPPSARAALRTFLFGVSCPSTTYCVAVGYDVQSKPTLGFLETWNGLRWTVRRTPLPPGTVISLLNAVSCRRPYVCTAVGYRMGQLGIQVALAIARTRT